MGIMMINQQLIYHQLCYDIKVRLNNMEIKRIFKNTMASKHNQANMYDFPSYVSCSIQFSQLEERHQIQMKNSLKEDGMADYLMSGFDLKSAKNINDDEFMVEFQLKRHTSFEDVLMQNHRKILVNSISELLEKTAHPLREEYIKTSNLSKNFNILNSVHEKIQDLEKFINLNEMLTQTTKDGLLQKIQKNTEEFQVIFQMIQFCPERLKPEILIILNIIINECEEIIQHFNKKTFQKIFTQKSHKIASNLLEDDTVKNLLHQQSAKNKGFFVSFLEKWMLTIFLILVGVFQNELESKSFQECIKSETLKEIDLSDYVNQQLIKPKKKLKK